MIFKSEEARELATSVSVQRSRLLLAPPCFTVRLSSVKESTRQKSQGWDLLVLFHYKNNRPNVFIFLLYLSFLLGLNQYLS